MKVLKKLTLFEKVGNVFEIGCKAPERERFYIEGEILPQFFIFGETVPIHPKFPDI